MPKSLHKRKDRKNDLEHIRVLRNRVFHHERIVHWRDLDAQHDLILSVIGWISPPLRHVTHAVERFGSVRVAGLPRLISGQLRLPEADTPSDTMTTAVCAHGEHGHAHLERLHAN